MSHDNSRVHVVVHYVAAEQPFQDQNAERSETVGSLMARVLAAFGLTAGNQPDGNIATYTFYHAKNPAENMGQTLGELAGDHPVLQLKLSQQIVQG